MADPIRRGQKTPPAAVPPNRPRGQQQQQPAEFDQADEHDQGDGREQGQHATGVVNVGEHNAAAGASALSGPLIGPIGSALFMAFLKALIEALKGTFNLSDEEVVDAVQKACSDE